MTSIEARRAALIEDADGWRGLPGGGAGAAAPGSHAPVSPPAVATPKEWQHFVVFAGDWLLVFNLSLEADGSGRIITLAGGTAADTAWWGAVAPCARPRIRPGRLDADFERAGMAFRGGRYELWQRGEGVELELTLTPASTPSLTHNIAFGPGSHVSWCLVPRLRAQGWVQLGERRVAVDGALAYHDHNWGRFGWGGDFSWDWGAVMPADVDCPWTVVFARMNDRARHRTTATSLFLLKDGEHVRYFRNAEVSFTSEGTFDGRARRRIPPAAALLAPERDLDLPAVLRFAALRGDEPVDGEIEPTGRAQVLVPAESDLRRVIRMNEAHARARVHGRCAGEQVELTGTCLLEVVRG